MSKRVLRDCPIPNCGAKYLVKISNHLADVHDLSSEERKVWLQEAKLQPKVHFHRVNEKQNSKLNPLKEWLTL